MTPGKEIIRELPAIKRGLDKSLLVKKNEDIKWIRSQIFGLREESEIVLIYRASENGWKPKDFH